MLIATFPVRPVKADGLGMVFGQSAAHPLPPDSHRLSGGLFLQPLFASCPFRR